MAWWEASRSLGRRSSAGIGSYLQLLLGGMNALQWGPGRGVVLGIVMTNVRRYLAILDSRDLEMPWV